MKRIFILLVLALFSHGCRTALLYTSNNLPTPLMKEERETQFSGAYGMNGVNFNLAASPLENIAISISGNFDKTTKKSQISKNGYDDSYRHTYSEGAVGYYQQLDEKFITEFYVGYGRGDASDKNYEQYFLSSTVHENFSTGKFEKYFLQTNFGSKYNNMTAGFAIRLSYLAFYQLVKENDGIVTYPSKKEALFFEPALFGSFGGKNVQFEIQLLFPYAQKDIDFDYKGFILSTGVRFIF